MNDQSLPNRRPTRRSRFKVLRARLNKPKSRHAAATATTTGEVPNFGVSSALIVILLLHLVVIGGLSLHGKWTKTEAPTLTQTEKTTPTSNHPKVETKPYLFQEGDSLEKIARKKGLDLQTLRDVNAHIPIAPGKVIRLPITPLDPPNPEEEPPAEKAVASSQSELPITPTSRPPIEVDGSLQQPIHPEPLVEANPQQEAVLVTSRRQPHTPTQADMDPPAPKAIVVEDPPTSTSRTHTIRSGDTIYGLARKYGVSPQTLLKVNRITNPKRIQIGQKIRIPAP